MTAGKKSNKIKSSMAATSNLKTKKTVNFRRGRSVSEKTAIPANRFANKIKSFFTHQTAKYCSGVRYVGKPWLIIPPVAPTPIQITKSTQKRAARVFTFLLAVAMIKQVVAMAILDNKAPGS